MFSFSVNYHNNSCPSSSLPVPVLSRPPCVATNNPSFRTTTIRFLRFLLICVVVVVSFPPLGQAFDLPPVPKENIYRRTESSTTGASSSTSFDSNDISHRDNGNRNSDHNNNNPRQHQRQRNLYPRKSRTSTIMEEEEDTTTITITNTDENGLISEEIDINAPEAPPGTLLLPGRRFPFRFETGEFTIHDIPIYINETNYNPTVGPHGATGLMVWDGSIVLAKYLEYRYPTLERKSIIEIGSGTGIVGLTSGILGGNVILTDLHYCLPNLQQTIDKNIYALKGRTKVQELNWEKLPTGAPTEFFNQQQPQSFPSYPFSLIVGADVVWVPELIEPLVQTLNWLVPSLPSSSSSTTTSGSTGSSNTVSGGTVASPSTEILIAHKTRSRLSDELFFKLLKDYNFMYKEIPLALQHPNFHDNDIHIFQIERKS